MQATLALNRTIRPIIHQLVVDTNDELMIDTVHVDWNLALCVVYQIWFDGSYHQHPANHRKWHWMLNIGVHVSECSRKTRKDRGLVTGLPLAQRSVEAAQ